MHTLTLFGNNTNSSSIHYLLNNDVVIPNNLCIDADEYCQLLFNTVATPETIEKFNVHRKFKDNYNQDKTIDWRLWPIYNKLTNDIDYNGLSFIINLIHKEQCTVFCDNDNELLLKNLSNLHNSFHRLMKLSPFSHSVYPVYANQVDTNTYVFYTKKQKVIIQDKIKKVKKPIMVDMKITDQCHNGCTYCYQQSSPYGVHADFSVIKKFINNTPSLIEVAIGGGEPTLHPNFMEIIKYIVKKKIIVNFTTRNKKFVESMPLIKSDFFGSIGYSIDNISGWMHKIPKSKNPLSIHIIAWPSNILQLLEEIKMNGIKREIKSGRISQFVILAPKITHKGAFDYFLEQSKKIINLSDLSPTDSIEKIGFPLYGIAINRMNELTKRLYQMYKDVDGVAFDTPMLMYIDDAKIYDYSNLPSYEMATKYIEGGIACYFDAVEQKIYNNSYEKIPLK